ADTDLAARHTAAYVEGLQGAGVAACTKHFPGHGDTNVDSHHALPRIDVDLDTLAARELVPFRAAIEAGTKAVMSAHILVPALDPTRPATLSPQILTGLLRKELGYEGLIVTDGMEMHAIAGTYGIERGSVLAIAAGADAICVGGGLADEDTVLRLRDALVAAVREGTLPQERLADAAARVRALAAWTQGARPDVRPEGSRASGIGLTAARRALLVTGTAGPLTGPYVATLTPVANIAVGDETPWGPAAELAALLPDTASDLYPQGATAAEILAAAGERTVVAVVRDAHRHPWMTEVLDTLVEVRPDTVVVEMGLPRAEPRGALHIATHGAARVCGRAAAEVVAGAVTAV
ncbi:glycoside hydrolase family 3 N-terminal domain-containing protein, partial [Streptomyces sp. WAC05950]